MVTSLLDALLHAVSTQVSDAATDVVHSIAKFVSEHSSFLGSSTGDFSNGSSTPDWGTGSSTPEF